MYVHSKHINPENATKNKWAYCVLKRSCKCSRNVWKLLFLSFRQHRIGLVGSFGLSTHRKMENLFKFFFPSVQAQSPEIICTSCTIVVLLALYSYSYQEHTIHFRFTLILIFYYFIILFCLLVVRIRCGAFSLCVWLLVSLLILYSYTWCGKMAIINNFLTQFYVLIFDCVVCL